MQVRAVHSFLVERSRRGQSRDLAVMYLDASDVVFGQPTGVLQRRFWLLSDRGAKVVLASEMSCWIGRVCTDRDEARTSSVVRLEWEASGHGALPSSRFQLAISSACIHSTSSPSSYQLATAGGRVTKTTVAEFARTRWHHEAWHRNDCHCELVESAAV